MKKQKIIFLAVLSILFICQSSWSQNLLEVEGELTVNPTNPAINVHGNFVENLANPQLAQDAATKAYVDNAVISYFLSLPNGLQTLLNAGETPLNIINAGTSPADLIGLNYQGGIIFYILTDGTGLVAAPLDQSIGAEWGCFGTDLPNVTNVTSDPPSGSGAEIGDGSTNTSNIIVDCPTAPAALACTQYNGGRFSDWFLPSAGELNEMYLKIGQGAGSPNTNIGNFAASFYWSSSEFCAFNAWGQGFSFGDQIVSSRDVSFRVRAIRAF